MVQYARPDTDISNSGWLPNVGTTLWETIDEVTPDDAATHMLANVNNVVAEIRLSDVLDPGVSTGHVMRIRAIASGGGQAERVQFDLYDGAALIRNNTVNVSRSAYTTYSYTLLDVEADAITDYTNLRFRFSAVFGNGETIRVTWAEFEAPDPTAATPVRATALEIATDYNVPVRATALEIATDYNIPVRATALEAVFDYLVLVRGTAVELVLDYSPTATYGTFGAPFLFEATRWPSGGLALEVFMRATAGTIHARLYDTTADAPVSGSDLSTVETGFTRLRSGGLPLIDGHVYRVQFGKGGTDGGEYMTAQLVSTE